MATIPTASSAPESQAPINHFGRVLGALFSPKPTFEDVARRPSWIAPLALLTVLGLVFSFVMNQRVDWDSFIRQQAEKNPRFAQLSEEQKQQALGPQTKFAPAFAYVLGGLGSAIFALLLTLIYWGAFNLFAGAGLRFGTSFGIASHAIMPSAISSVLGIVTMYLKQSGEVDPENIVASNVGALLAEDAPKWLAKLGSYLDVFDFWMMFLLATGFAAANPKKISLGKALGIVFGLWAVYVLIKVVIAAI